MESGQTAYCRYCKKNKPIEAFKVKNNRELYKTCLDCMEMESLKIKKLDPSTFEQEKIVEAVYKINNVLVDAVAGSGKTTTALHIAKRCHNKKIAIITYNKKLCDETKRKVKKYKLMNVDVFTYHGSCNTFYLKSNGELVDDLKMKACIDEDMECINKLKLDYDIIIVDEVQDMNITYCKFIKKLIEDNRKNNPDLQKKTCIVVFGDKNQCINQYNKANYRFLTMAPEIFKNDNIWISLKLTETFRVPQEICDFLNNCMLQENRMVSRGKDGNKRYIGHKPRYFITSSFTKIEEGCDYVMREVQYYLNLRDENGKKIYKNEDIFILAPSVKNKAGNQSPVILLANMLAFMSRSNDGETFVYITNDNVCDVDEKVMKNKIVFSTHNSVKGLERKVVIVFNFDNSYFQYFDKENDPNRCPNRLYVGVTRACERLSMIHHFQNDYLPFLKGSSEEEVLENIKEYCELNPTDGRGNQLWKLQIRPESPKPIEHSVTDLIKYLNVEVVFEIQQLISKVAVAREQDFPIELQGMNCQSKDRWEVVADINGTAIPLYYAIKVFNRNCYNTTEFTLDGTNDNENILRIANRLKSEIDNSYYKYYQIDYYNWMSQEELDICVERMNKIKSEGFITEKSNFNEGISVTTTNSNGITFTLNGEMDYFDKENVFEFKCVNRLDDSHFIQLLLYKYINEKNNKHFKNYYLYNILSDELYKVDCTKENLECIIDILIKNKETQMLDDRAFREQLRVEGLI